MSVCPSMCPGFVQETSSELLKLLFIAKLGLAVHHQELKCARKIIIIAVFFSNCDVLITKCNLKPVGERSFCFIAPSVWNLLPAHL